MLLIISGLKIEFVRCMQGEQHSSLLIAQQVLPLLADCSHSALGIGWGGHAWLLFLNFTNLTGSAAAHSNIRQLATTVAKVSAQHQEAQTPDRQDDMHVNRKLEHTHRKSNAQFQVAAL